MKLGLWLSGNMLIMNVIFRRCKNIAFTIAVTEIVKLLRKQTYPR